MYEAFCNTSLLFKAAVSLIVGATLIGFGAGGLSSEPGMSDDQLRILAKTADESNVKLVLEYAKHRDDILKDRHPIVGKPVSIAMIVGGIAFVLVAVGCTIRVIHNADI